MSKLLLFSLLAFSAQSHAKHCVASIMGLVPPCVRWAEDPVSPNAANQVPPAVPTLPASLEPAEEDTRVEIGVTRLEEGSRAPASAGSAETRR